MTPATKNKNSTDERNAGFDRELRDLSPELRWRDWMGRVEAVLLRARRRSDARILHVWLGRGLRSSC